MAVLEMYLSETPFSGNRDRREHKYNLRAENYTEQQIYDWLLGTTIGAGIECERPDGTLAGPTERPLLEEYDGRVLSDVSYQLRRDRDPEFYEITATYEAEADGGTAIVEPGSIDFSFDLGPENEVLRYALENIDNLGPAADFSPDFGLAINVQEDGTIEGTQVPSSAQQFTLAYTNTSSWFSAAKRNAIGRTRGHVNSTAMTVGGVTYAAGEVRFLGASGRIGSTGDSTIEFRFGVRENVTGITVPGLNGSIDKKGWHYFWVYYVRAVDTNSKSATVAKGAYVDRLLPESDLNGLFT